MDVLDRFNSKWDQGVDGCWNWTAYITVKGYGSFERTYAHRWSYEYFVGPIDQDMQIDHLCRNRKCVNPFHLEVVSSIENTRRGNAGNITGDMNRSKTHCPKGHEYSEENTYRRPDRDARGCRICRREATRASRARKGY